MTVHTLNLLGNGVKILSLIIITGDYEIAVSYKVKWLEQ